MTLLAPHKAIERETLAKLYNVTFARQEPLRVEAVNVDDAQRRAAYFAGLDGTPPCTVVCRGAI